MALAVGVSSVTVLEYIKQVIFKMTVSVIYIARAVVTFLTEIAFTVVIFLTELALLL